MIRLHRMVLEQRGTHNELKAQTPSPLNAQAPLQTRPFPFDQSQTRKYLFRQLRVFLHVRSAPFKNIVVIIARNKVFCRALAIVQFPWNL